MKLKKIIIILILCITLLPVCISKASIQDLDTYSPSIILIDKYSGKILYEKDARKKMYPASVTKVMTAILALEYCKDLNETTTVSYNSVMTVPAGHSIANLQMGEELSINDLLYALLLKSGNDAANVLAEYVSGSVSEFAVLMNEKVQELGCENTNFVNPSGIHNENHYTTAYDLSLIAKYCMENETFRRIVSTSTYTLPATNKYPTADRVMGTTNDMLRLNTSAKKDNYYYEYCIGIKTGYTSQAKNTLITAAARDGLEFIAIVLGAGQTDEALSHRYLDSIALFNYAFDNYRIRKITNENNLVQQVYVKRNCLDLLSSQTITTIVKNENFNTEFVPEITLREELKAPITRGEIVGTAIYNIEGIEYTFDLIAGNDIAKITLFGILLRMILISIILFIILLILNKSSKNNRKKQKGRKTSPTYNHYQ